MPKHIRQVQRILNDIVGEGRREVSGVYIPWATFSGEEQKEIKDRIKIWEVNGFLEIIGDLDTWESSRVCYKMNNFVEATEPLPDNWLQ